MKKDYLLIFLSIASLVLLVMVLNIKSELTNAYNMIGGLTNRIERLDDKVNHLNQSVFEMDGVLSQEDIIVAYDYEIEPVDLMAGAAETSVQLHVNNVHKDSSVTLVLTEKERVQKNNYIRYVLKDGEIDFDMMEITGTEQQTLGTFKVEMESVDTGVYSATFDVLYNHDYEVYALIEYDGIVYQEKMPNFYVIDHTKVQSDVLIHFADYDKNSEQVKLNLTTDFYSDGTAVVACEVVLKDGNTVLERINLLEESDDIHSDTNNNHSFYDFYVETTYVPGETRVLIFTVEDEWGRITEIVQEIEMT